MNLSEIKKIDYKLDNININGFFDFDSEMTNQFNIFFKTYFINNKIKIEDSFKKNSCELFEKFSPRDRISLGDCYFNNFTIITGDLLNNHKYRDAFILWTGILDFVKDWEKNNPTKKLHKGTPYYFSAVSSILSNDFDAAMMAMHNALAEDKINNKNWQNMPAYSFLTLDYKNPNQHFKNFVDGMVGFIADRLDGTGHEKGRYKGHYKNKRGGIITYDQFRSKFLDNQKIDEEIRFLFVYALIRFWHLRILHVNKVGDPLLAPVIFSNVIFLLLLVIDKLLCINFGNAYISGNLASLAKQEGWDNPSNDYIEDLDVNKKRDIDFDVWLKEVLGLGGCNYKTKSGRLLSQIESDFALAYGLRNFSAHTIRSQAILWQNYTEILQALLNCLFKTVEII